MLKLMKLLTVVSILIVLDVILEVSLCNIYNPQNTGFNPYCVGCNLRSPNTLFVLIVFLCFNPYCVGCNLRSPFLCRWP